MIKISGGPLPTTRYPTAPSLVCATRTGADTTEAVAAVGFTDEEQAAILHDNADALLNGER